MLAHTWFAAVLRRSEPKRKEKRARIVCERFLKGAHRDIMDRRVFLGLIIAMVIAGALPSMFMMSYYDEEKRTVLDNVQIILGANTTGGYVLSPPMVKEHDLVYASMTVKVFSALPTKVVTWFGVVYTFTGTAQLPLAFSPNHDENVAVSGFGWSGFGGEAYVDGPRLINVTNTGSTDATVFITITITIYKNTTQKTVALASLAIIAGIGVALITLYLRELREKEKTEVKKVKK